MFVPVSRLQRRAEAHQAGAGPLPGESVSAANERNQIEDPAAPQLFKAKRPELTFWFSLFGLFLVEVKVSTFSLQVLWASEARDPLKSPGGGSIHRACRCWSWCVEAQGTPPLGGLQRNTPILTYFRCYQCQKMLYHFAGDFLKQGKRRSPSLKKLSH